jgi:outer membrane protein TolC
MAGAMGDSVAEEAGALSTLPAYLAYALEHNPSVIAARRNVEAELLDYRLALSIPDPVVSGGVFVKEVETRVGAQRARVGVSQSIPWPGKLAKRRAIEEQDHLAARQRLRAIEARVLAQVRQSFAAHYATGRWLAINRENLRLLDQMESLLRSRYTVGEEDLSSVVKIQVEMAIMQNRIDSLAADGVETAAALRALLNLERDVPVPFPDDLPLSTVPDSLTDLLPAILDTNPRLGQVERRTAAADAAVALARRQFGPDFAVMSDYIFVEALPPSATTAEDNGSDAWIVGASLTLPVWVGVKIDRIRKAKAQQAMWEAREEGLANELVAESTRAVEDLNDARRAIALHEGTLIPLARQTLSLTEEAYRNDRATVLDFLDAQRRLLDLRMALASQRARREAGVAMIDQLMGGAVSRGGIDAAARDE